MVKILWIAVFTLGCTPLAAAPTLVVSSSPMNLPDFSHELSGSPARVVIGCLRFAAENDTLEFNGFTLTVQGTGDWAGQLANRGVRVYCDSFNGGWDETDQLIARSNGASPTVSFTTFGTLSLPAGKYYEFWIVLDLLASGADSGPVTFKAGVASETDVKFVTPGAVATIATPAPETAELTVTGAPQPPQSPDSGDEGCHLSPGPAGMAIGVLPALAAIMRRRRD